MLVSVLVPVYGVEKYIERCAVSLFEQTYPDIEYIFVNDCTPDRSMDILRSVMDRYPSRKAQVRIIDNPENRGLGAARATAMAAATGDCVTHVDSDDFVSPRAVELLCRKMEETGVDIVDGGWQRVTPKGLSEPTKPYPCDDDRRYLCLMLCQNVVSNRVWGRLFRRVLYTKNDIFPVPGIDYCEDFALMPRLMFHAHRASIDDVVYYYSDENASSYTHSMSPKHILSFIKANALVLDFFTRNDTEGRYLFPLQLGMMNVMRTIRLNGYGFAEADKRLRYKPEGILFSLLCGMFRGNFPYCVAEKTYLTVRRIYVLASRINIQKR